MRIARRLGFAYETLQLNTDRLALNNILRVRGLHARSGAKRRRSQFHHEGHENTSTRQEQRTVEDW
jgi:hypothetical protein